MSSCIVFIFFFFSLFLSASSAAAPIPISLFNTLPHSDQPLQRLTQLASAAVARASHLKNGKNSPPSTTPLFPFNGAYTVSLSFGTPPQPIPMIIDTGSSFSWFPCTKRYVCRNCSSSPISSFLPKQSSSAKFLGCMNPKCGWLHKPFDPNSSCRDCQLSSKANCTQICPPYILLYGLGSTGGVAMVETLTMAHGKIEDFLVGCSLFSSSQPAGVVGFGRGASSLPSQLGLRKFSYCHVSHKFDNSPKSSFLMMDSDSDSGAKTAELSYTPLLKNPGRDGGDSAVADYYYVGLRRIVVGGRKVEVSYRDLVPDSGGNGGTIVDSGSTFVYMNKAVFEAVYGAFAEQVKGYKRAAEVEGATGLRPCFDITGHKDLKMPEMELHFKGGAEMVLPLENYFFVVDDGERSVLCLTVVTDDTLLGPDLVGGPSVILGNFLMQNFHVEYDLRNERFGFRQKSCS